VAAAETSVDKKKKKKKKKATEEKSSHLDCLVVLSFSLSLWFPFYLLLTDGQFVLVVLFT
jgi:hypothetical protein